MLLREMGLAKALSWRRPICVEFKNTTKSQGRVTDETDYFRFANNASYHAVARIAQRRSLIPNLDLVTIRVGHVGAGAVRTEFAPREQLALGAAVSPAFRYNAWSRFDSSAYVSAIEPPDHGSSGDRWTGVELQ